MKIFPVFIHSKTLSSSSLEPLLCIIGLFTFAPCPWCYFSASRESRSLKLWLRKRTITWEREAGRTVRSFCSNSIWQPFCLWCGRRGDALWIWHGDASGWEFSLWSFFRSRTQPEVSSAHIAILRLGGGCRLVGAWTAQMRCRAAKVKTNASISTTVYNVAKLLFFWFTRARLLLFMQREGIKQIEIIHLDPSVNIKRIICHSMDCFSWKKAFQTLSSHGLHVVWRH